MKADIIFKSGNINYIFTNMVQKPHKQPRLYLIERRSYHLFAVVESFCSRVGMKVYNNISSITLLAGGNHSFKKTPDTITLKHKFCNPTVSKRNKRPNGVLTYQQPFSNSEID